MSNTAEVAQLRKIELKLRAMVADVEDMLTHPHLAIQLETVREDVEKDIEWIKEA